MEPIPSAKPIGIAYTGHPFVDVGLATMTRFCEKRHPSELTPDDFDAVATYIEREYVHRPLKGYLTMAFTSNAWFCQDAYNPDKEGLSPAEHDARLATRTEWAGRHLRQWGTEDVSANERCVFTGLPAVAATLSKSLSPSRAARAQIPLVQGDESINFFADGMPGVPISAVALLALQFMPMGCAKSGIGLLAVHSDDDRLTYALASRFFEQNQHTILQAQAVGDEKLPGYHLMLRTLLVDALTEAVRTQAMMGEEHGGYSLIAYNFNNGKTPDLKSYPLPSEIVDFLRIANTVTYRSAWNIVTNRAWQPVPVRKQKAGEAGEAREGGQQPARNYVYEDLFDLPNRSARFIRRYFLRIPQRGGFEDDPRRSYSAQREIDLISWPLVALFLERIMHVEDARIEQIRALGDKLADYVRSQGGGGKRFFRNFFTERNFNNFRTLLIKANIEHVKAGRAPLFDMDGYIEVFEDGFEVKSPTWYLARDLVLIRMIDQLRDWLSNNQDAVPEDPAEQDEQVAS